MKKTVIALLLLCVCCYGIAQTKKEKQVATAVEQLRLAMLSGDRAALESITAPQLSYGHSGGAVEGQKDFIEKIASGKSDFVTIELTEPSVIISGKTAIVRHLLSAVTNDNGKPGEVKLKVLLIWQKQKGKWKLLARQAVKFAA